MVVHYCRPGLSGAQGIRIDVAKAIRIGIALIGCLGVFAPRGVAQSTPPASIPTAADVYFEFQVEKPAVAKRGNPVPTYPEKLMTAGVEGEVLIQVVVDTSGKADMSTVKVLKSSDELFVQAVTEVLPWYRFVPAELEGRRVKQWVQMPFQFTSSR